MTAHVCELDGTRLLDSDGVRRLRIEQRVPGAGDGVVFIGLPSRDGELGWGETDNIVLTAPEARKLAIRLLELADAE